MKSIKRNFIKFLGLSLISSILYPFNSLIASAKKVINPNLSVQQKDIMFNEGTERAFTSSLLTEKRKGTYHCANCGALLFNSMAVPLPLILGMNANEPFQS